MSDDDHQATAHDLLIRIDERVLTIQKWLVQHSLEAKARDEAILSLKLSRAKVAAGFTLAATLGSLAGPYIAKLIHAL